MVRQVLAVGILAGLVWHAGCSRGPKPPPREPVFPVTGIVEIDGKPTPLVKVYMYSNAGENVDTQAGSRSWAMTDPDGKFKITTYESGDGAPAGDYKMAFYWEGTPQFSVLGNADEPKLDPAAVKFNRKYNVPGPNAKEVKVEAGESNDLGTIELTTK